MDRLQLEQAHGARAAALREEAGPATRLAAAFACVGVTPGNADASRFTNCLPCFTAAARHSPTAPWRPATTISRI